MSEPADQTFEWQRVSRSCPWSRLQENRTRFPEYPLQMPPMARPNSVGGYITTYLPAKRHTFQLPHIL